MRADGKLFARFAVLAACFVLLISAEAQERRVLTADDYARAEKFMSYNTSPLVYGAAVRPTWLSGERFWYRNTTAAGAEFILVDPAKGTRAAAFDHAKLAAALSEASGAKYEAARLPFQTFEFSEDEKSITFSVGQRRWSCNLAEMKCAAAAAAPAPAPGAARGPGARAPESRSPDGKKAVFIRDWNLWLRDIVSGQETQLTSDGVKDFGYATDNAGWTKSDRPIVLWSPDSKKIATFQLDQRKTGEMYLADTRAGHPNLQAWKYPLPGDENVTMIERVVIELEPARVVRFKMSPDQHRSSLCDDISCAGGWEDVQWHPDGTQIAFVSTSRDHKEEWLRVADARTGEIREVYSEKAATYFESGIDRVNWLYLPKSNEFLWWTQRDNWGHLYLYDLGAGKLKHQITRGESNVAQVLRVDEQNRMIYFRGVGREAGRDPYFIHFYRVGFDGKKVELLTPEDANHSVTLSPEGKYFVDSYSKPDVPPVTVLRDAAGKLVVSLEKADISKLIAAGWKPPRPITVKARDGVTDLYGLMFVPTYLDSSKKYPIVNQIYPGPQTGSVGWRSFAASRGDTQALAELGFIVVQIDGTCTPWRSKKFQDACFADMGDNTLADQVTGMKQLAAKYPWIDIDRAGVWGHSGGGYATAAAMFKFPDFFKVGVSQAGNHDNRVYEDDWAEKWQGLLTKNAGGGTNYDSQANQNFAKNLKGKLLLAHGTLDDNVPYYSTLLVVNELIRANKDFDLILFPNRRHGFGGEPYMVRRRWDYFVRHLMGAEPPAEYQLRPPTPQRPPGM